MKMSASVMTYVDFDDESLALELQIEDIIAQRELQTGKWTENNPPDFALAFDEYETELKHAIFLIKDAKFAYSIAKAVDSDFLAIQESRVEETQALQDRELALSLNQDENLPSQFDKDLPVASRLETDVGDWDHVLVAAEASTFSDKSYSTVAGPSNYHTLRQKAVFEYLPQLKVECFVCTESVHPHFTVRLACDDVFCKSCLKSFFLRAAKDQSLYPPRCHSQIIDISTIEEELSVEDLAAYRSAELEFTSTDKVYCADPKCNKFIPMPQRALDHAFCNACGAGTCMHCKELEHDGECLADEAKQGLIDFAHKQGWKACFGCGEMISRYEGCDHMTCKCGAEFCYRCGEKWKTCLCDDWVPELLNQRAEQIVDREAQWLLAPAIRQQRVVAMAQELRTNHECDHSGKFTRLEGSRRGKVCEICGARHYKYILSCKRCHILACEFCRCHRL